MSLASKPPPTRRRVPKRARPPPPPLGLAAAAANDADQGGGDERPAKRPPLTDVQATLEPGARLVHGTLQMPASLAPHAVERLDGARVLPPRDAQTSATLAAPEVRPLVQLLADLDAWHEQPVHEALRQCLAPHLLAQAAREHVAPTSLERADAARALYTDAVQGPAAAAVDATAPTRGPKRQTQLVDTRVGLVAPIRRPAPSDAARAQSFLTFYASDPEPDPDAPFELAPGAYPMMRAFLDAHAPQWRARAQTQRETASQLPRVSVEQVTRDYTRDFWMPPDLVLGSGPRDQARACCRGAECLCATLAHREGKPAWAYVAREFLAPSALAAWRARRAKGVPVSVEADGAPGPCLLCLRYAWTLRASYGLMSKHVPAEPINTVSFCCQPGEYARECMLPTEVDGYPTGIEGFVPAFAAVRLQYAPVPLPLPPGAPPLPLGAPPPSVMLLHETQVDFHDSLSQTNACLGGRKLRPLSGTTGATLVVPRALVLPPFDALRRCEAAGHGAWARWVQASRPVLLADRVLCAVPPARHQGTRVPVVWLRLNRPSSTPTPAEAALASFEASVTHLAALDAAGRRAALAAVADAWRTPVLAGLAQAMPALLPPPAAGAGVVWQALAWRLASVAPLALAADPDVAAHARLFLDTHLDVLAAALAAGPASTLPLADAYWLGGEHERLAGVYPHAVRVSCADELPDLLPLLWSTNPWYDSAKKGQPSFVHSVVHTISKGLNQVCQRRGYDKIMHKAMSRHPAFCQLVALILRVVLLGNVPDVREAPSSVWLRLRLHLTFATDAAALARMQPWIAAHPLLSMTLIREYYLYVMACDGAADDMRATSRTWARFKALNRHAVAAIRSALPSAGTAPVQWALLERRVGNSSVGMVLDWHERGKEHNMKLRKGTEVELMIKKITSVENKMGAALEARGELGAIDAWYAWMRADGRLEALHVCAWAAARDMRRPFFLAAGAPEAERRVVPLRWLKPLGMSARAFDAVRHWVHDYCEYNIKDDGFKRLFETLFRARPTDGLLLDAYLRLIAEYYSHDALWCAPLEQTREQWRALRVDLDVEPWATTPARLGMADLCEGCMRWTAAVLAPPSMLVGAAADPPAPERPLPLNSARGRAACAPGARLNPMDGRLYCSGAQLDAPAAMPVPGRRPRHLVRPLLADYTCNAPLVTLDMVGVYRRVQGRLFGRCCFCGHLCEVLAAHMTNEGLSCGRHVPPSPCYPRDHRIWLHLQRPEPAAATAAHAQGPAVLAGQCSACTRPRVASLAVYDEQYRLHTVPLCRWHLFTIHSYLPAAEVLSAAAAAALPPLRWLELWPLLARYKDV